METQESFFSESIQNLKDYCNDRMLLLKLQMVEKLSNVLGVVLLLILLSVFGGFILLFLSISAAFFFAARTGSESQGFLIVAGIYLLLLLILWIAGKVLIQKVIINSVIRHIFNERKEDNELQQPNNEQK